MKTIPVGTRLYLHCFGPAIVRKLVVLDKQLTCEVAADGALMHLSIAYVQRLLAGPAARLSVVTRGPMPRALG